MDLRLPLGDLGFEELPRSLSESSGTAVTGSVRVGDRFEVDPHHPLGVSWYSEMSYHRPYQGTLFAAH